MMVMWRCPQCCCFTLAKQSLLVVQSPSCVWLFVTPWTAAQQASLSLTISQSLPNTDVHCISDAIQPSHPLTPSCALSLFPASGTFPMSWLFALDDQNTRALASPSVLPMSIQGCFSLELTSLIYLLSKGLSGVCSSTTAWRHQFFGGNSCLPLEEGMATHSSILAWRIPMDRGAWRAAVYGVAKSVITEQLNTAQHTAGSSTVFSLCLQKRILCWEWTSTSSNLNI